MRLTGRMAVRAVAALALVPVALLVGALTPRPLWPAREAVRDVPILVLFNPIHSDIALPLTPAIRDRFGFLAADGVPVLHPDARWLIVGWGARTFYTQTPTWSDLKPWPVARAFTSDASVLHVDVAGDIAEPHPDVVRLSVGANELDRLARFTLATFEQRTGSFQPLTGLSYGATDRFYEAKGRFNAFLGCNTWTAAALRTAGLRSGVWNPLPQTLSWSLRLYN